MVEDREAYRGEVTAEIIPLVNITKHFYLNQSLFHQINILISGGLVGTVDYIFGLQPSCKKNLIFFY